MLRQLSVHETQRRHQSQIYLPKGQELGSVYGITNRVGGGSERGECGEGGWKKVPSLFSAGAAELQASEC